MATLAPISTYHTELPPCCVQVVGDIAIIGTYHLELGLNRWGSIDVMKISPLTAKLTKIESHKTKNAILDIKQCPQHPDVIVSAHSEGNLIVWRLVDNHLTIQKEIAVDDDTSVLITSVHFSPTDANQVVVTLTSGYAATVDLNTDAVQWLDTAHELECWTANYSQTVGPVVYTGGDDAKLIAHDLRTNEQIFATNHRHHQAGVVAILSPTPLWNSSHPHQLWTGSYDDHLRIFDLRVVNDSLFAGIPPTVAHEQNLGGGVWRLVPRPNLDEVLACCMYDGGRVISPGMAASVPPTNGAPPTTTDIDPGAGAGSGDGFSVVKTFKGDHESMVYGGDWINDDQFITCSFYDKVVHVWNDKTR